jgi:glycosyltransferase involved in cell wall biosynthesis
MRGSKIIFKQSADYYAENEGFYEPLVSFVIPVLNSERTLERCLKSIICQNYQKIEVIVVDGGSTDGSVKIAEKYGAKIYYHKGLLGDARRLGIEKSSGDLIALWDSDIYIPHPKWLLQGINTLNKFSKASTLWVLTAPPPDASILTKAYNWFSWATMLFFAKKGVGFWGGGISIFRRKAIEDVGGITKGIDTGEDYDLARKLAMKDYEVIFYNDPVYHDTHDTLTELIRKDLRRAKNFKKVGLANLTGIPLRELLTVNLTFGIYLSLKNLFVKKKIYFGMVPIVLLLRLIAYLLSYLLR